MDHAGEEDQPGASKHGIPGTRNTGIQRNRNTKITIRLLILLLRMLPY